MKLTVNGEPVSKEAVELEYRRLMKTLSPRLPPDELARRMRALQRQALDHAIGRKLLLDEARRLEIRISREEIDRAVDGLTQACGGDAGFQAHLKKLSLSLDALRQQIQEARQIEKLIEQITASCPEPTEEEMTAYFKEHAHEFVGKDTQPDSLPSFESVRDRIRLRLLTARKNKILTDAIARLRQSAVIEESETGT